MGVDAIVVLPLPAGDLAPRRAWPLKDGCRVFTGVRWGEPLDRAIRATLGAVLDRVTDPRGVFAYPDVIEPRSDTVEGVIAEVGDAGMWVVTRPPAAAADDPLGRAVDAVGLDALARFRTALASGDRAAAAQAMEELHRSVAALDPTLLAELEGSIGDEREDR